ncbi:MAG TPA: hypothetical protein VMC83_35935 [Streptosporangiaceae bacterium]|nr:hypothetical protein [Streptosporangiaceae bacterium]
MAATSGDAHRESVSVTAAPHRTWVKYYIVPPSHNGQKAFLYGIAAQVLGNGNLYPEIFNLNKGRLQPDGARLENPSTIDSGWILILPAAAQGPGVHFGPLPAPHRTWVKYYIVPPPHNGQKAFLFEIAAQVLGNGNLYPEIFNLNKGRLQPDGARLENPSAIDPGWILILPAAAQGPGVHFGPLPGQSAAGQQDIEIVGVPKPWILRALVGCLALLGMILMVSAVRAWLTAQRGQHRYGGARPLAAGRGVSQDVRRSAPVGITQSADQGAGRPVHLPRTASTAAMSPPPAPSLATGHRLQTRGPALGQEPCSLPPATAGASSLPQAMTVSTGRPLVATGSPLGLEGRGWAPSVPAARDPAGNWSDGTDEEPLSPAALRLLGVRTRSARQATAAAAVLRHEVVLGDYRVQAVLAEAPASNRERRSPEAKTWVASAPYLVWTPLPHDVPDGLAFACVGAGNEGCLFIDLAAAPGAVALGGEYEAAARLAESIAHQLCSGPSADRIHLVVVGDAVPTPHPPGREWVRSVGDLGLRGRPSLYEQAELVFCRLNSNEDVFPLARYVASAPHRVVPVVLADLPGAPWSFTAYPSRRRAGVLQPVVS